MKIEGNKRRFMRPRAPAPGMGPLLAAAAFLAAALLVGHEAMADAQTIQALRMANTLTGGLMPSSAPEFAQMVTQIRAGNYQGAAQTAVTSRYFAQYLPRRMARQMMNSQLSESSVPDNDATTFIVANLIGSATTPSIRSLWSQDATYLIRGTIGGVTADRHAWELTPAQLAAVNWQTDLIRVSGQTALVTSQDAAGNTIYTPTPIPAMHVGGYLTLAKLLPDGGSAQDFSFAQYGLMNGTNLRAIEAMYETTTGLTLPQMVVSGATSAVVPRFVPKLNPSFFTGQGQPACISCHGGGASNLTHGYATFADKFDFDPDRGLIFIPAPTTDTMKSFGSNDGLRGVVRTCDLTRNPAPHCNPDAPITATSAQAWNLSLWQTGGLLTQMGWQGPTSGTGLNSLGQALGQAKLVYRFLVTRVVREICPLGSFNDTQIGAIADLAQTQDSFATIAVQVAIHPSCY
jgi:hypothetical protein